MATMTFVPMKTRSFSPTTDFAEVRRIPTDICKFHKLEGAHVLMISDLDGMNVRSLNVSSKVMHELNKIITQRINMQRYDTFNIEIGTERTGPTRPEFYVKVLSDA